MLLFIEGTMVTLEFRLEFLDAIRLVQLISGLDVDDLMRVLAFMYEHVRLIISPANQFHYRRAHSGYRAFQQIMLVSVILHVY
jgi:hypothetical protein